MCKIVLYAASGPSYCVPSSGTMYAITRCETHGLDNAVVVDGLCAFGQIDKKLDMVIAKLDEAVAEIEKAMP